MVLAKLQSQIYVFFDYEKSRIMLKKVYLCKKI